VLTIGLLGLASVRAYAALPATPTTDEMVKKFATAASSRPTDANTWVQFGDILMQKGRETADAAYCSRAEAAYEKALKLNDKNHEALTGMAWVSGVRHEFEASIDWANKALAVDPNNIAAFGLIGDAAIEMGNYDKAYEAYQKMLDLRPDLSSYSRSAHLLQVTGDSRRATWLMSKAIEAGSPYGENTAWCRSQLALIYFQQGAYMPADKVLTEGLKSAPNDYRLLAAMGKVKAAEKDYEAAIDYYRRSVAIAPQEDVVAALGDVLMVAGNTDEAKKQYAMVETIAKLNKVNGVKGDMLTAKFYADHDMNLPEALKMAEAEYETRKNVYQADVLAWCYFKNGRLEDARKLMRVALSKGTPEAMFYFHQGMIETKAGNKQAARLAFYTAASMNPNFDVMAGPLTNQMVTELGAQKPEARPTEVSQVH
jgi:tetratricopeptide (TPR) repeat protein